MKALLDAAGPRLTEPSTWLGLFTLAGNVATWAALPANLAGPLSTALASVAGVVLVIIREREAAK